MDLWNIRPGQLIRRQDLCESFGFPMQTGIAASSRSQHVALYAGRHNRVDNVGWIGGEFYYLGAEDDRINRIVIDSMKQGRCLHLFQRLEQPVQGRPVNRYVESFVLSGVIVKRMKSWRNPARVAEIPIFKLAPLSAVVHRPWQIFDAPSSSVTRVRAVQRPDLVGWEDEALSLEVARLGPEGRLENSFCRHLFRQGVAFHRWQINYDRSSRPLFTDVWIPGRQLLVETKASSARNYIREAIGQLVDYTRFVQALRRAILVPEPLSSDLVDLLHGQEIAAIWPNGREGWDATADWLRGI